MLPTAGEVLLGYLVEQVEAIRVHESAVGSIDQAAIHKTRVATRRLRSVLSSYRRLLRREQTDPLRDELRWLAMALGAVRDTHVFREHLRDEASDVLGLGGLPAEVERQLGERERAAVRELHGALDSVRYAELRRHLDALMAQPPLRRRAQRPAKRVLPSLAGKAARGVDEAALLADADGLTAKERDDALHDVRKAAKEARYAAELALPVGGKGAALLVTRMTQLQEVLGQRLDGVMSRQVLAELSQSTPSSASGAQAAFAAGVLAGHDLPDGALSDTAYREALQGTSQGKARRWTRGRRGRAAPVNEPGDGPGDAPALVP